MHNYGEDFDPLATPRAGASMSCEGAGCSRGTTEPDVLHDYSAEDIAAQFKEVEYWNNVKNGVPGKDVVAVPEAPATTSWFRSASMKVQAVINFMKVDQEEVLNLQRQAVLDSRRKALQNQGLPTRSSCSSCHSDASPTTSSRAGKGAFVRWDSTATDSHLSVMSADTHVSANTSTSACTEPSIRHVRREQMVRSGSAMASFLARGAQEVMAPAGVSRDAVYKQMYTHAPTRSTTSSVRPPVPPALELV